MAFDSGAKNVRYTAGVLKSLKDVNWWWILQLFKCRGKLCQNTQKVITRMLSQSKSKTNTRSRELSYPWLRHTSKNQSWKNVMKLYMRSYECYKAPDSHNWTNTEYEFVRFFGLNSVCFRDEHHDRKLDAANFRTENHNLLLKSSCKERKSYPGWPEPSLNSQRIVVRWNSGLSGSNCKDHSILTCTLPQHHQSSVSTRMKRLTGQIPDQGTRYKLYQVQLKPRQLQQVKSAMVVSVAVKMISFPVPELPTMGC